MKSIINGYVHNIQCSADQKAEREYHEIHSRALVHMRWVCINHLMANSNTRHYPRKKKSEQKNDMKHIGYIRTHIHEIFLEPSQ